MVSVSTVLPLKNVGNDTVSFTGVGIYIQSMDGIGVSEQGWCSL